MSTFASRHPEYDFRPAMALATAQAAVTCRSPAEIEFQRLEEVVKQNELFLKRNPGHYWYWSYDGVVRIVERMIWNQNPEAIAVARMSLDKAVARMEELTA